MRRVLSGFLVMCLLLSPSLAWAPTGFFPSPGQLTVDRQGRGGTPMSYIKVYTPTLTPNTIAGSQTCQEQTFTVTGLVVGDKIFVNPPSPEELSPGTGHTMLQTARVSAADTLALGFCNPSSNANATTASGSYTIFSIRTSDAG